MKKEDEMVDRVSQKFGITSNKTRNAEETSQMKRTTKTSPALQEALVGFLSRWPWNASMDDVVNVQLNQ